MRDFAVIEQRMRSLVASLKVILPEKGVNEVLHFIEHGEYGVALEELKDLYDENARSTSKGVLTEMLDIAKIMEMKLD